MSQLIALLHQAIARFERGDEGATMVEYALIVVFIALVVVLGATLLGNSISSLFSSIAGSL